MFNWQGHAIVEKSDLDAFRKEMYQLLGQVPPEEARQQQEQPKSETAQPGKGDAETKPRQPARNKRT